MSEPTGVVAGPQMRILQAINEQLLAQLVTNVIEVDGHLEWQGSVTDKGYPVVRVSVPMHRLAYEVAHGPIPDGLHVDHVCMRKRCMAHLEAVTQAENNRRLGASRTHCKNNHPYTVATTWLRSNGARGCRICRNASSTASRKRKKELAGV